MSYVVNKTDGNIAAVVEDGTINSQTSIKLVGIGYENYAETVAEDLVQILENFAGTVPPVTPLTGQLWYNKTANQLMVYDTVFKPVNNVKIGTTYPILSNDGDFYYDNVLKQLFFSRNNEWQLIAPLYSDSQGRTEYTAETITDNNNKSHTALVLYVAGVRQMIISSDDAYQPVPYIIGFNFIKPGINIPYYETKDENIHWGGNGNAFSNGTSAASGVTGQLQYNNLGFFAGTSGITTDESNLQITGNVTAAGNLTGKNIVSTAGVVFPDGSIQTSAAGDISAVIRGQGSVNQIPVFTDTRVVIGSPSLTTDGLNFNVVGTVTGSTLISTQNGILFPDNTVQTTAAFNNSSAVNGTGQAGQLSYFTDQTHVASTQGITTNGSDITVNGTVSLGASGLIFNDGSTLTTSPVNSASVNQIAYYTTSNKISGSSAITINGSGVTINGMLGVTGINFADGTSQTTSAVIPTQFSSNQPGTFGSSGMQKLPSGLIIQWGITASNTGTADYIPFNTPFPNAVLAVTANEYNAMGWIQNGVVHPTIYGVSQPSKTGFYVYASRVTGNTSPDGPGLSFSYIALGY